MIELRYHGTEKFMRIHNKMMPLNIGILQSLSHSLSD